MVEVQGSPKKAPKKQGKKIQKQEKAKRSKKDLDMTLHSTAIKLDSPFSAKTKETLVWYIYFKSPTLQRLLIIVPTVTCHLHTISFNYIILFKYSKIVLLLPIEFMQVYRR